MRSFVALSLSAVLISASCRKIEAPVPVLPKPAAPAAVPAASFDPAAHKKEIEAWQTKRAERLKAEDGWLSLVGLHWLKEGVNAFGSDKGQNDIDLPANAPALAGKLTLSEGKVTLEPIAQMTIDGQPVTGPTVLLADADEKGPTFVQLGSIQFQIIKRGERYAVRAKDPNAETRVKFQGLEYYPVDAKWRVEARLERYEPPKKISITDVTGTTAENESPGALVFTLEGKEHRLDPIMEAGDDQLFIIFRDGTSQDTTYPAGRYLYATAPGPDGKVIIDFNRAYNPPCAFTEFATCPLPPLQNRLSVRVEGGEKKYAGGHV